MRRAQMGPARYFVRSLKRPAAAGLGRCRILCIEFVSLLQLGDRVSRGAQGRVGDAGAKSHQTPIRAASMRIAWLYQDLVHLFEPVAPFQGPQTNIA